MLFVFWAIIVGMTLIAVIWLASGRASQRAWVILMIVLFIPALAFTLYWRLGNSDHLFQYWALRQQADVVKSALLKIKDPKQLIDKLKLYLELHPSSPKGWYLLGKLYYGQRDYAEAVVALRDAYQLAPENAIYAVSYVEADFFNQGRRLSPVMRRLLLGVLKRDKNNVGALNLLAINDYLRGQYRSAIRYWERLLPLFPAGSKDQQFLLTMLSKAQKKEK